MDADFLLVAAFVAGLLSFFSPCILPLLPVFIGYVGGTRGSVLLNGIFFVLGFGLVFTLFGAGAGVLGKFLAPQLANIRIISAVVLVIFGLTLLEVISFTPPWGNVWIKPPSGIKNRLVMSLIVSVIFALAWTPCVGLILGSILTLAVTFDDWQRSTLLLALYSLGLGVPFLIAALFFDRLSVSKRFTPYTPWLKKIAGLILIVFAVLIQLDLLKVFVGFLSN